MKNGDIIELKIEKIVYSGAGLGFYDGIAVFIKKTVPEDIVRARLTKLKKSYAEARLIEVIEPSPHRTKPICPLQNACGSCNLQFVDYEFLIEQKEQMLYEAFRDNLPKEKFLPFEKSPKTENYRKKAQYPIGETKNSKRILAGYYREQTHEITNIKFCPIQPPVFDKLIDFIRENWEFGAWCKYNKNGLLRQVVARINNAGEIMLTLVLKCETLPKKIDLSKFQEKLQKEFPEIVSLYLNFNPTEGNRILGEKFELIYGEGTLRETLEYKDNKKEYKIGAESFFQTNPACASQIFSYIKEHTQGDKTILDAYGGVGAIGIWVSDEAKKIALVEENKNAIQMAKENFKLNNIKNYEVYEGDAKVQLNNFYIKKKTFDCAIIDPPRKGSDKGALDILTKITDKIIYMSCNPETLARDVKILEEKGFECESVKGFDMFPWTHHIEAVAIIRKKK